MDAHLFRLFMEHAMPFLEGALVEKIQEPRKATLVFSLFNKGVKRQFVFHYGKQSPFCFFTSLRLSANAAPSAEIMRIRKYFAQKRIAAVIPQYWRRKLWLMASGQRQPDGKNPWLLLDFKSEPVLYFLDNNEIPEMDHIRWPQAFQMEEALRNWRDWPMLTPALRKTLFLLDVPEQMSLLADLEDGGGDVFIYKNARNGSGMAVTSWPLPKELAGGLRETVCQDILPCLENAGRELVLAPLFESRDAEAERNLKQKIRQRERLLANLEADEQRLLRMAQAEKPARELQSSLWHLDKDSHVETLRLEESGEKISLDKRFSILENMRRMFKAALRGKRGLQILAERRARLREELTELHGGDERPAGEESPEKPAPPKVSPVLSLARTSPKNVSVFRSSDGFALLRGKDAKGNAAVRRMAAPHDLWAHVEKGQGAHVAIRRQYPGQEIPERTLMEAGALAANKSWLAQADLAAIMYAEIRHIKPMRKGEPGMVSIDKLAFTRLVEVRPELETELLPR